MRDGFRVIDADCHQMESASMWRDHIDVSFRDRAPGLEDVDGRKVFQVEGESIVAEGKYPFSAPEFHAVMARAMMRFKRLREAGFGASARLQDMDEYGVDVQILYPTVGGQLLGREFHDSELLAACCRAYNDWSAAYCSQSPARLRWAAMLPLQAPDLAIEEARRAAVAGCVGFYVRPNPVAGRNLYHADYDALWSEIEELGRPLCIHDSGSPHLPSFGDRMDSHVSGHILAHPFEAMAAMAGLIWYGVFERHPKLTVVHVEADAGWLPYWLQRMEQHWEYSGNAEHPELSKPPTAYFLSNMYVAARGDERTLGSVVELVGDDNVVFNTDYPHPDGTFPWGFERFEKQVIPADSKRKILWDNAARAFGINEAGLS